MYIMSGANYGGRQPNNSAYIKNFYYGTPSNLWTVIPYTKADGTIVSVITPTSSKFENVYIPGDLYVDGNIISPSDVNLKNHIETIDTNKVDKLLNLNTSQFTFKNDPLSNIHYGFIAQELQKVLPYLVSEGTDKDKILSVDYNSIIPVLTKGIQEQQALIEAQQKQIDEMKLILEKLMNDKK